MINANSSHNSNYRLACVYFCSGRAPCCICSGLEFNYNYLNISGNCLSLSWSYERHSCVPATFTLQGFQLQDVSPDMLDAPRVLFTSSFPTFTVTISHIVTERLYFRIIAKDENGYSCDNTSLTEFYDFSVLLQNGTITFINIVTH